jgi:hypothetical protein
MADGLGTPGQAGKLPMPAGHVHSPPSRTQQSEQPALELSEPASKPAPEDGALELHAKHSIVTWMVTSAAPRGTAERTFQIVIADLLWAC